MNSLGTLSTKIQNEDSNNFALVRFCYPPSIPCGFTVEISENFISIEFDEILHPNGKKPELSGTCVANTLVPPTSNYGRQKVEIPFQPTCNAFVISHPFETVIVFDQTSPAFRHPGKKVISANTKSKFFDSFWDNRPDLPQNLSETKEFPENGNVSSSFEHPGISNKLSVAKAWVTLLSESVRENILDGFMKTRDGLTISASPSEIEPSYSLNISNTGVMENIGFYHEGEVQIFSRKFLGLLMATETLTKRWLSVNTSTQSATPPFNLDPKKCSMKTSESMDSVKIEMERLSKSEDVESYHLIGANYQGYGPLQNRDSEENYKSFQNMFNWFRKSFD